jgi:hypothetical protein
MTVFVFGLIMFPPTAEPPEKKIRKIAGLCVSMVGVILYTIFEIRKTAAEKAEALRLEEEEHVGQPIDLHVKGVEFEKADVDPEIETNE